MISIITNTICVIYFDKTKILQYNKFMDKSSLLKLIKNLRVGMSLSQSAMAAKIGMSTSFYGMIERGERTMSIEYFFKIAEGLDCSPIDLLMILEQKN